MDDINPEFLAGLAKLETRNGAASIKGTNNLYNIKDFSGGGVRAKDKAEGSNDAYRVYASHEESTADLIGLLKKKYPKALTAATGQEFAQALKDGGYATDPDYVAKLTNVIAKGSYSPVAASSLTPVAAASQGKFNDFTAAMPGPRAVTPQGIAAAAGKEYQEVTTTPTPVLKTEADLTRGVMTEQQATLEASENTSIGDVARAKFMHEGIGPLLKRIVRPDFDDVASPGYVVDEKNLAGLTSDERDHISAARSTQEEGHLRWEMEQRRADEAIANRRGAGAQFLGSALAGLPVDYATGMAVGRVFSLSKTLSSVRAAAEGRKGAAIGSSVAENALGGAVLGAVNLGIDPYYGANDFAMEVAGSAIIGAGLQAPGIWSAADKGAARVRFTEMAEASARRSIELHDLALKNLGPDPAPEVLAAEMRRIEADSITRTINKGDGYVSQDRRLLPEDEALRADVPEAPEAEVKAPTRDMEALDEKMGIDRAATDAELKRLGPKATAEEKAAAVRYYSEKPDDWSKQNDFLDEHEFNEYLTDTKGKQYVAEHMEGVPNLGWVAKQAAGTHVLPEFAGIGRMKQVADAVEIMVQRFLPEARVTLGALRTSDGAMGSVLSAGKKTHLIGISPVQSPKSALATAAHEVSHAVIHDKLRHASPDLLARLVAEHKEFLDALRAGRMDEAKFRRFNESSQNIVDPETGDITKGKIPNARYSVSFDEWLAEGGTRFIQKDARGANQIGLTSDIVKMFKEVWESVKQVWDMARGKGWIPKDMAVEEFFQRALDNTLSQAVKEAAPDHFDSGIRLPSLNRTNALAQGNFATDPDAVKHGLETIPTKTVQEAAEAKAILSLYKKAEAGGYHTDEKRLSWLMDTAAFHGAQGTANVMLRSANPVVRMIAAELLESASGAGGRRSSAAIAKHLNEHAYLGNALNDFQSSYKEFRKSQGENIAGDFFSGTTWERYNRMVAEHIESLRPGASPVSSPPSVMKGAEQLRAAYERIRQAQVDTKTVGWASLPETSTGYMPHKMSPEKFRNMTVDQERVLHSALVDQFIGIEGFDITFSQNLASKYMDRVRRRGLGGFEAPMGIHQVGAADIVEDALTQMGMGREEVTQMMRKYMAGGAGHTKRRLQLDLSAEHALADGSTFKLMDLFETDQFKLLRSQAARVSGEVALANHGVMGKSGLKLLRRAMEFGGNGERALASEIEAFDQVSAEFLGDSFGTQNKLVDRALQVTSLSRLGGMGFTQLAEGINGIFHVGALRTLDSVFSIGRLRSEIKALARGEKVDNPILGSLEAFRGAEFGTESYKTVFPFDNQSLQYQTYGKDTVTAADRLLRGGQWVQGKLSLWRTLHSTQQRGMAEQIVRKAAQYIKDGSNDAALRDMGITDELASRLRADMGEIAQFNGNRLMNFDITKARDLKAAEEFTQSIHRGVSQIIQGTFIGERGAWAHDGVMRMMTQFRTFSLTSVEKQWGRQVGNVGVAKALGMVVGSMSLAAPIYMARTYLASVGRADQDEYLEKQLTPAHIARASLNYIAAAGLSGDLLDALTAVTGVGTATGGRAGGGSDFVGNVVAPAAGTANDLWKGLQNTKEGTDPTSLIKALPFSRLPYLIPAVNALGD